MGSGEQARDEAVSASALLKELIESGIDAHDAMQTINGLYILRDGGGFAAIDLLQVSLVTAEGFLHKWGAAPSFLKFGRTVQRLGSALPPRVSVWEEATVRSASGSPCSAARR